MKRRSKKEQAGFEYVRALVEKGLDRTREEEHELLLYYFRCAANYQEYHRNCHMPVCRRNRMCSGFIPPKHFNPMRDHGIPPCIAVDEERRETCRLMICARLKMYRWEPGRQYTGGF